VRTGRRCEHDRIDRAARDADARKDDRSAVHTVARLDVARYGRGFPDRQPIDGYRSGLDRRSEWGWNHDENIACARIAVVLKYDGRTIQAAVDWLDRGMRTVQPRAADDPHDDDVRTDDAPRWCRNLSDDWEDGSRLDRCRKPRA